jgi:transmembrane sensor
MSKFTDKTDFISLVQDEAFIQSVIGAENPKELLEELQKKNPDQSEILLYAFEFILVNRGNKVKMSQKEYNRLLDNIHLHLKKKPKNRYHRLFPLPMRVAASILVIISVCTIVFYRQIEKDPLTKFAQMEYEKEGQALIFLSDGTKKVLKNNNSFIDYSSAQGEVVVKDTGEEERIGNRKAEKNAVLNQVVVPYGQRHKVLLSDGTLVQLNAGSKLTFPATFSGKFREVYLSGEGFFEVQKNEQQAFIVKTEYTDIKVIGTAFNVTAYDDERFMTTILVEGKVTVSQKDKLLGNEEFTLAPGQGCFYTIDTKSSVVRDVDVNDYVLWKEGLYNFGDKPLRDVVSRVHKYFNHPVIIESDILANTLISGKLVLSDNIAEVVEYLSKTVEGRYEITPEGLIVIKQ